ncbi:MAG: hypothetical protein H0T77_11845 [Pyrinomonadaceae bacterium]|nr:hypothetical protein [Pyrinomonadaceae bacterium]
MKHPPSVWFLAPFIIVVLLATPAMAQRTAQERAAGLRQQLAEVQAKQTELETRFRQLEEDLKPENIEKGLAGTGSTRPEELREQRRRQLEIEKKNVQTRLDQLAISRTRFETGIVQADAAAYHSSAGANAGGTDKASAPKPLTGAVPAVVTSPNVLPREQRGKRTRPRRVRRRA